MSNIKKLPTRKLTKKKSSVVPFKRGEQGKVVNIEERVNRAIELRLEKFVKEIQTLKAKQKKLEARRKITHEKCEIEPIGKIKKKQSSKKTKPKKKKK